jgi:CBS domain-containing protein
MLESHPVAFAEANTVAHAPVSSLSVVANSRLLSVSTETLLTEVAALLSSSQSSLLVVCDAAGSVAGVITETMLVRQLGVGRANVFTTHAGAVMNRDYNTCTPADSLPDVLSRMHQHGQIHVLIVEVDNKPLGVLNARDGLRALLAAGNHEEALLRNYVMGVGYQ